MWTSRFKIGSPSPVDHRPEPCGLTECRHKVRRWASRSKIGRPSPVDTQRLDLQSEGDLTEPKSVARAMWTHRPEFCRPTDLALLSIAWHCRQGVIVCAWVMQHLRNLSTEVALPNHLHPLAYMQPILSEVLCSCKGSPRFLTKARLAFDLRRWGQCPWRPRNAFVV